MKPILTIATTLFATVKRDMRVRWGAAAGASVLLSAGVLGVGGTFVPEFLQASTTPRSVIPQERLEAPSLEVADMSTTTVWQIIAELPKAERFEMMLYNSGADEVLKKKGTYTVFVPASANFDYLPARYIASLTRRDAYALSLRHIVARDLPLEESLSGTVVTAGDTMVEFEFDAEANAASVAGAKVIKAYKALNGTVYLIDRVLTEENLR